MSHYCPRKYRSHGEFSCLLKISFKFQIQMSFIFFLHDLQTWQASVYERQVGFVQLYHYQHYRNFLLRKPTFWQLRSLIFSKGILINSKPIVWLIIVVIRWLHIWQNWGFRHFNSHSDLSLRRWAQNLFRITRWTRFGRNRPILIITKTLNWIKIRLFMWNILNNPSIFVNPSVIKTIQNQPKRHKITFDSILIDCRIPAYPNLQSN